MKKNLCHVCLKGVLDCECADQRACDSSCVVCQCFISRSECECEIKRVLKRIIQKQNKQFMDQYGIKIKKVKIRFDCNQFFENFFPQR